MSSAKYYHSEGMIALKEMLRHAQKYGLKYIFVHDDYYDPFLTFGGWRKIDSFNHGETTVWTTLGVPKATKIPSPLEPPAWQGIMWGTVPFGMSLLTIALACGAIKKFAINPQIPATVEGKTPEPILGSEPQEVAL